MVMSEFFTRYNSLSPRIKPTPRVKELRTPPYFPSGNSGVAMLTVASLERHMTDEAAQLGLGFQCNGVKLIGNGYSSDGLVHAVNDLPTNTGFLIIQDGREWHRPINPRVKPEEDFKGIDELGRRNDIFKVVVVKDAHCQVTALANLYEIIRPHAFITYYDFRIVGQLARYLRPQHLIRTYHSINPDKLPTLIPPERRKTCIISGANSKHYSLRRSLINFFHESSIVDYHPHPGYHRNGSDTDSYLRLLTNYNWSIATSSAYGYCLRKIIESLACGCSVVTDLPAEDVLPYADDYLYRVNFFGGTEVPNKISNHISKNSTPITLEEMEYQKATVGFYYDYRRLTKQTLEDIKTLASKYNAPS